MPVTCVASIATVDHLQRSFADAFLISIRIPRAADMLFHCAVPFKLFFFVIWQDTRVVAERFLKEKCDLFKKKFLVGNSKGQRVNPWCCRS